MIPSEKELIKRARITALSLGFFCITALVSLTYAIFQKTRTDQCEAACLAEASKNMKELEIVTTKLNVAIAELEKCRQTNH